MKISIMLKTVVNLGDHGMEQWVAHECDPQETVGELVDRLLVNKTTGFMSQEEISVPSYNDFIQIRLQMPIRKEE